MSLPAFINHSLLWSWTFTLWKRDTFKAIFSGCLSWWLISLVLLFELWNQFLILFCRWKNRVLFSYYLWLLVNRSYHSASKVLGRAKKAHVFGCRFGGWNIDAVCHSPWITHSRYELLRFLLINYICCCYHNLLLAWAKDPAVLLVSWTIVVRLNNWRRHGLWHWLIVRVGVIKLVSILLSCHWLKQLLVVEYLLHNLLLLLLLYLSRRNRKNVWVTHHGGLALVHYLPCLLFLTLKRSDLLLHLSHFPLFLHHPLLLEGVQVGTDVKSWLGSDLLLLMQWDLVIKLLEQQLWVVEDRICTFRVFVGDRVLVR